MGRAPAGQGHRPGPSTRCVQGCTRQQIRAAEVALNCLHLPPPSPSLTTWGYVSLAILYLLTREPLENLVTVLY